jgi:gliding motility-associated-like protein
MRNLKFFLTVWWLSAQLGVWAQSLHLALPDTTAQSGDTITVAMTTAGFEEIVSIQFSINWDPAVIKYLSHQQGDLNNVAIGPVEAAEGILRLSWFDIEGVGRTMPDGSTVLFLRFEVTGQPGDYTELAITDEPLFIQIYQATGTPGVFLPIDLEQDTGSVAVVDLALFTFNIKDVRCPGDSDGAINLSALGGGSGFNFQWTGPGGFTSQQEDLAELAPGVYNLTVTDAGGNVVLDTTLVVGEPDQLVLQDVMATASECTAATGGATLTIAGGTPPYTYDIGQGPTQSNAFTDLIFGNYNLSVTDANGCTLMDTFEVPSPPLPALDLGPDRPFCVGQTVTLNAGQHSSYQWSTGSASASITVAIPGTYSVTVANEFGCTASDTVIVRLDQPIFLEIENDLMEICPGDSLQLVVSGGESYQWIDPSQTLSALDIPDPISTPQATTTYTVMSSNACYSDTVSLEVVVYEVTATAGPDTCVLAGDVLRLYASGGVEYFWQGTDYPLSNNNIPDPFTQPEDSTSYFVTIIDANGCVVRDTVHVMVVKDPRNIRAVNLITPNGDGKNDVLEFEGIGKLSDNTLKVYNRWGDLVYTKVNYQMDDERFDGTYKGKPLPAGTYFYVLSFRTGDIRQALTIVRE